MRPGHICSHPKEQKLKPTKMINLFQEKSSMSWRNGWHLPKLSGVKKPIEKKGAFEMMRKNKQISEFLIIFHTKPLSFIDGTAEPQASAVFIPRECFLGSEWSPKSKSFSCRRWPVLCRRKSPKKKPRQPSRGWAAPLPSSTFWLQDRSSSTPELLK